MTELETTASGVVTVRYPIRVVRIKGGWFKPLQVLIEDSFGNEQWLSPDDVWNMNIHVHVKGNHLEGRHV